MINDERIDVEADRAESTNIPLIIALPAVGVLVILLLIFQSEDTNGSKEPSSRDGGSSEALDDEPSETIATTEPTEGEDTPTEEPPVEEPVEEPTVSDVDAQLAIRGVERGDVVALGLIADQYGYGLGPGTSLPYDEAEDFAFVIMTNCDLFRAGNWTVEDQVLDDISTGAPASDAEAFWAYAESTFCPNVN